MSCKFRMGDSSLTHPTTRRCFQSTCRQDSARKSLLPLRQIVSALSQTNGDVIEDIGPSSVSSLSSYLFEYI